MQFYLLPLCLILPDADLPVLDDERILGKLRIILTPFKISDLTKHLYSLVLPDYEEVKAFMSTLDCHTDFCNCD